MNRGIRMTHTQRRTLPEFSLEGKVAVGKDTHNGSNHAQVLTCHSDWVCSKHESDNKIDV
jgi:hypothetical protein